MKLSTLNIWRNKIHSLDALRDMPLHILIVSQNPITDLEPLSNLPLETLGIAEIQTIQNYEVLSKTPIHYLLCSGNNIRNLNFVRGTSINRLSCHHNLISDLEPLRDLPLRSLQCGRNQISSLEPLRGKNLVLLGIEKNQITTLEPLRGMKLAEIRCQSNQLTSLEPFVDDPPRLFLFDSNALTTEELQRVAAIWDKQTTNAAHALNARISLALLTEDVSGLKKLAVEFERAHYLLVPHWLHWKEAQAMSQKFGGRLLNIQNESDVRFLESIREHTLRYWTGNVMMTNGQISMVNKDEEFPPNIDEVVGYGYWVDHKHYFTPRLDQDGNSFCIRWE